jgi:hypothetical protein
VLKAALNVSEADMSSTKQGVLFVMVIQAVLIVVLGVVAIHLRNELIGARAGTDYYRKALIELQEDHETALRRILLYQREDLQREYLTTLDVAVRYGIVPEEAAARQIQLSRNPGR